MVYVDDIVIIGPSSTVIDDLKSFLHTQFKLKDLRNLKYFLGLEITRSSTGIVLSQLCYTLHSLKIRLFGFYAFSCSQDPKLRLNAFDGDFITDQSNINVSFADFFTSFSLDLTLHMLSIALANMFQPHDPHLQAAHNLLTTSKLIMVKDYTLLHLLPCN